MIEVVSDEKGTIRVSSGGLLGGKHIIVQRSDGEKRSYLMIESQEEYEYDMTEAMKFLGLVDENGKLV